MNQARQPAKQSPPSKTLALILSGGIGVCVICGTLILILLVFLKGSSAKPDVAAAPTPTAPPVQPAVEEEKKKKTVPADNSEAPSVVVEKVPPVTPADDRSKTETNPAASHPAEPSLPNASPSNAGRPDEFSATSDVGQPSADADPVEISRKLKKIVIAMHDYIDIYKHFPVAAKPEWFDETGRPNLSWRVHLLPYLDQTPLYEQFHLNEPWDSEHNKTLLKHMPDVFRSVPGDAQVTRIHTFTGPETPFVVGKKPPHFADFLDGTTQTILIVHAAPDRTIEWTRPVNLKYDPAAPLSALGNVGSRDIQCAMADGSVVRLPGNIAPQTFAALVTPNGKEIVDIGSVKIPDRAPPSSPQSPTASNPNPPTPTADIDDLIKLRTIGFAYSNFHNTYRQFPPSRYKQQEFDPKGNPYLSWRVHLLPFLDQEPLYNAFKLNEPWDSPHNKSLMEKMPSVFRSAGDPANSTTTRMVRFTGRETPFARPDGPTESEFKDGSSNTILVFQAPKTIAVPWTKPEDIEFTPKSPFQCIGRIPGEGLLICMADGSVERLKPTVSVELFKALITPQGGEPFELPRN